jgi:hypothetical protein
VPPSSFLKYLDKLKIPRITPTMNIQKIFRKHIFTAGWMEKTKKAKNIVEYVLSKQSACAALGHANGT